MRLKLFKTLRLAPSVASPLLSIRHPLYAFARRYVLFSV